MSQNNRSERDRLYAALFLGAVIVLAIAAALICSGGTC